MTKESKVEKLQHSKNPKKEVGSKVKARKNRDKQEKKKTKKETEVIFRE